MLLKSGLGEFVFETIDLLTKHFGTPTWGHSSGANPHPSNSATFNFECASDVVFDAPTALCSDGFTPLTVFIISDD